MNCSHPTQQFLKALKLEQKITDSMWSIHLKNLNEDPTSTKREEMAKAESTIALTVG